MREKKPQLNEKGEKTTIPKKRLDQEEILLVEFKAPKGLIDAFDFKLRTRFSSRSEAIRSLMRAFLEELGEGV